MKLALVELHDVSPHYKAEFLFALELLEEVGCYKFSLLIVPFFWQKKSFGEDRDFLSLVKSIGLETVLHGYTHEGTKRLRDMLWTDREGEFSGLGLEETYRRVSAGVELLDYLGLQAEFFVPPAWIGNPYLEDVLYSLGFKGVAYRWHIKDLTLGNFIKAPALTFSNRHLLSWLSLKVVPELERLFCGYEVLRLAVHMMDFRDRRKVNLWREMLLRVKNSRRWTSYGELFGKGRPSSSFKGFQPAGWVVQ